MEGSSNPRANRIRSFARSVRTAWSGVGLTLALVAGLELALRAGFALKDAARPLPAIDPRVVAGGYDGQPWVEDLYRELTMIAMERLPYAEFRARPFAGRYHTIDGVGERRTWRNSRENSTPATGTPPEIVLVGGSSAWGWGARDDATLASQVAKRLADAGIDAHVTNLAQIGYVSNQEWIALVLWLRAGHRADLVVSYGGVNDVLATYQNGRAGEPQHEANRRREFNILSSPRRLMGALAADRVAGSALFRLAGAAARRLGGAAGSPAPAGDLAALPRATADAYAESLGTLARIGRENGFAVLAYLQPVVFTKRRMTSLERERAAQYDWVREPIARTKDRLKERLNDSTRAGSAREGPPRPLGFRDLGPLFDDTNALIFTDFCHTTESANDAIAAAILPDILEALGRRTPP